jgi:hypothetical protein
MIIKTAKITPAIAAPFGAVETRGLGGFARMAIFSELKTT